MQTLTKCYSHKFWGNLAVTAGIHVKKNILEKFEAHWLRPIKVTDASNNIRENCEAGKTVRLALTRRV